MSCALEVERGALSRSKLIAWAIWIATGVFSAVMVARISERAIGIYRHGTFATEDIGELLLPFNLWVVPALVMATAATAVLGIKPGPRVFLIALAIHLVCVFCGSAYVEHERQRVVESLVARAQETVDAIDAFELRYGNAPSELEQLVPEFLRPLPVSDLDCSEQVFSSAMDPSNRPGFHALMDFLSLDYDPASAIRPGRDIEYRVGNWIVTDLFR
ncbi:MAG TPA: hypothetical protein VK843_11125 [Planctomycetota bacterium]|nr:hypothetical protein [Planctomycetota bacterium]